MGKVLYIILYKVMTKTFEQKRHGFHENATYIGRNTDKL